MGKLKKERVVLGIFFLFIFFSGFNVYADEIVIDYASSGLSVCFDTSGKYLSSFTWPNTSGCAGKGNWDRIKYVTVDSLTEDVESKKAYCMDWGISFGAGKTHKKDTTWEKDSKNALIAGMIISNVANDYTKDSVGSDYIARRYQMIGATLNTYMSRAGVSNGVGNNFYSKNSTVKGYVDLVENAYKKIKSTVSSTTITKPVFSYDGSSMSAVKNSSQVIQNYISSKITFSTLKSEYGYSTYGYSGTDKGGYGAVPVDYSLTAYAVNSSGTKLGDVEVLICKGYASGKGSSCSATVDYDDLKKENGYGYFYLKLPSDVKTTAKVRVVITGTNTSKYWTSNRYVVKGNSANYQSLIVRDSFSVDRSVKVRLSVPVEVPDDEPSVEYVSYNFSLEKINENGDDLEGAELEFYSVDKTTKTEKVLATNNGGSSLSWKGTYDKANNTFTNYDYYVREKSTPSGYVLLTNPFQVKFGTSSTSCYEEASGEKVNLEFCQADKYRYSCFNGTTYEDVLEDGVCPVTTPNEGESITEDVVTYEKVCIYTENGVDKKASADYCANPGAYIKVSTSGNNVAINYPNKKNIIRISKLDATGDKEITGAELKICSEQGSGTWEECTPAKTIDNVSMKWISGNSAKEFYGVNPGTYYIVEITPPTGYVKITTTTKFTIDKEGNVVWGGANTKITNEEFLNSDNPAAMVVNNQLNSVTISKQDIVTSNEVPGATLSICQAYKDDTTGAFQLVDDIFSDDDCVPPEGMGDDATWVSGTSPKTIKGLATGYYYLVEKIAPTDYSSAEAILFEMRDDGKIYDISGKLVSKNKIVMYDKRIEEVKTGQFSLYVVVGLLAGVGLLGSGTYYYITHKNNSVTLKSTMKIRKRKIHKKN